VDQSFVSEMEKDAKNLEIIRGIVGLAHNLEKKVIVEGIETEPQLAQVKAMGCEYGQGYLFAKPLPMEQAEELLRSPKSFP
ncbi:MAG: EAL domain-containing protein, partial [Desulfurivibrio sp.]|nr:EAL domain-containing protein [Desulfurivibrio sp.]